MTIRYEVKFFADSTDLECLDILRMQYHGDTLAALTRITDAIRARLPKSPTWTAETRPGGHCLLWHGGFAADYPTLELAQKRADLLNAAEATS